MNEILLVNPARRKRRKKTATRKRRVSRRKNPVRRKRRTVAKRRTRRRKSNPAISARSIKGQLTTASTGALGALGLDIALAYIPLPAAISGGIIGKVVKGFGAVALGLIVNKLGVSAANANRVTEGALTVQLHGIGKELLGQFAPGVAMSAYMDEGLGYYGSGWNPSQVVDDPDWTGNGMASYLTDISTDDIGIDSQGLGYYESESGYGLDTFN